MPDREDWTEGQLEFDFTSAMNVTKPEKTEHFLKMVDFVVTLSNETWLIECKDPEGAPPQHLASQRKGALAEIMNDALLKEHLLPKIYGTYAFHCLSRQPMHDRVRYIVILGLSGLDPALRITLKDSIQRVIDQIGPKFYQSRFYPVVEVHNAESWNAMHASSPINRHLERR